MATKTQTQTKKAIAESHEKRLRTRAHTLIVREYLTTLEGPRTYRKDPEKLQAKLDERMLVELPDDPIKRLEEINLRIGLELEIAEAIEQQVDGPTPEEKFIEVAAEYAETKHIRKTAWTQMGVPQRVLQEAGIR